MFSHHEDLFERSYRYIAESHLFMRSLVKRFQHVIISFRLPTRTKKIKILTGIISNGTMKEILCSIAKAAENRL